MRTARAPSAALLLIAGVAACGGDAVATSGAATTGPAAASVPVAAPAQLPTRPVATLPLRLGDYVASDTPCSQASNAAVSLLRRGGIGGSRDFCAFKKIERTAPRAYRVTRACKNLRDKGRPQVSVVTYTVSGVARFDSTNEHGWVSAARRCDRSRMPAPWRHNDIRGPSR